MTVAAPGRLRIRPPVRRELRPWFLSEVEPAQSPSVAVSSEYRRGVTRHSPLRFALIYLPDYLRLQGTDLVTFSEFHVDIARSARRWRHQEPSRDAWLGPRGLGKTVWLYLILPLWALAHGHRRFLLALSYTKPQAVGHLANLRMELETNELLRQDFPELLPRRIRGAQNTAQTVVASGATIAARGLGETSLGIRSGADRPDLVVIDDAEPSEADYSPAAKGKLLSKLVEGVLPMASPGAVVQLAGTVTMRGSITHDLVLHALGPDPVEWVTTTEFVPHYWPGVLTDPETGEERSLWPERWELTDTHLGEHRRGTRSFALNMELNPAPADGSRGGTFWKPETFRYDTGFDAREHVLYADVAVTTSNRSDLTAIVVLGVDAARRRAVVEYAWDGRVSAEQLRQRIHRLHALNPRTLRTVRVEANQGGDLWRSALDSREHPLPPGITFELEHVRGSKRSRLEAALALYEQGRVVHRRPLRELEEQLMAYPDPRQHDDLGDALAGALRWAFES